MSFAANQSEEAEIAEELGVQRQESIAESEQSGVSESE